MAPPVPGPHREAGILAGSGLRVTELPQGLGAEEVTRYLANTARSAGPGVWVARVTGGGDAVEYLEALLEGTRARVTSTAVRRRRTVTVALDRAPDGSLGALVDAAAAARLGMVLVAVPARMAARALSALQWGDDAAALDGALVAAARDPDGRTAIGTAGELRQASEPAPAGRRLVTSTAPSPRPVARRRIPVLASALLATTAIAAVGVAVGRSHPTTGLAPPRAQPVAQLIDPPPRRAAATAYDSTHDEVVMIGGVASSDGAILGDTWSWRGGVWARESRGAQPPPREAAVLVDDPELRGELLLGGFAPGGGGPLDDEWRWDGHDWHQVGGAGREQPVLQLLPAAAYDRAHHRVVMVCVCRGSAGGAAAVQTWTQDGRGWQREHPARQPAMRSLAAAAYSPADGTVVLVESSSGRGAGATGETWSWDGTEWTPRSDAPVAGFDPLSTQLQADPASGQLVLTSGPDHTVVWDGGGWSDAGAYGLPAVHAALVTTRTGLALIGGPTPMTDFEQLWFWIDGSWHRLSLGGLAPRPHAVKR